MTSANNNTKSRGQMPTDGKADQFHAISKHSLSRCAKPYRTHTHARAGSSSPIDRALILRLVGDPSARTANRVAFRVLHTF